MNTDQLTDSPNSRRRRKDEAAIHNTTMDIAKHILAIGQCTCSGDIFLYLKSEEDNIYNIYCTNCELKRDFRTLDEDKEVKLYFSLSDILYQLVETYGEETISKTGNFNFSKKVH